jgi:hypothetical protein
MDFLQANSLLEGVQEDLELGFLSEAMNKLGEAIRIDPHNFYGTGPIADPSRKGAAKAARSVRKSANTPDEPGEHKRQRWNTGQKAAMYRKAGADKGSDRAMRKHLELDTEMKLSIAGRGGGDAPMQEPDPKNKFRSGKWKNAVPASLLKKKGADEDVASPAAARAYAASRAPLAKGAGAKRPAFHGMPGTPLTQQREQRKKLMRIAFKSGPIKVSKMEAEQDDTPGSLGDFLHKHFGHKKWDHKKAMRVAMKAHGKPEGFARGAADRYVARGREKTVPRTPQDESYQNKMAYFRSRVRDLQTPKKKTS